MNPPHAFITEDPVDTLGAAFAPFYLLDTIPVPVDINEHQVFRRKRFFTRGWPLMAADPLPYGGWE